MKTLKSLHLAIILMIALKSFGQNPSNLYLTSQNEIDNFSTTYPNCTSIPGDVYIIGPDITNLDGLNSLTYIGGMLGIQETSIKELDAFPSLEFVGGDFYIYANALLKSIGDFPALTFIENSINFWFNDSLISIGNFTNLTTIEEYLNIRDNKLLETIGSFNRLETISNISIFYNPKLEHLPSFPKLQRVDNSIEIGPASQLKSLQGLNQLKYVGKGIALNDCYQLESLESLENLDSIGSFLSISRCNSLIDLNGLSKIHYLNGAIVISENNNLKSLTGLESAQVGVVSDITIRFNPFLTVCDVKLVCNYLSSPTGNISIYCNKEGCNNYLEILEACSNGINNSNQPTNIRISPNPAKESFQIEGIGTNQSTTVSISDLTGCCLMKIQSPVNSIGLENIKPGIYIVRVEANGKSIQEKLIVN